MPFVDPLTVWVVVQVNGGWHSRLAGEDYLRPVAPLLLLAAETEKCDVSHVPGSGYAAIVVLARCLADPRFLATVSASAVVASTDRKWTSVKPTNPNSRIR